MEYLANFSNADVESGIVETSLRNHTWFGHWYHLYFNMEVWALIDDHTSFAMRWYIETGRFENFLHTEP